MSDDVIDSVDCESGSRVTIHRGGESVGGGARSGFPHFRAGGRAYLTCGERIAATKGRPRRAIAPDRQCSASKRALGSRADDFRLVYPTAAGITDEQENYTVAGYEVA